MQLLLVCISALSALQLRCRPSRERRYRRNMLFISLAELLEMLEGMNLSLVKLPQLVNYLHRSGIYLEDE